MKLEISIQRRYLIIDANVDFFMWFNDNEEIKFYMGRYILDMYSKLSSTGKLVIITNPIIEYDETLGHVDLQFTDVSIRELTGELGTSVSVQNWPDVLSVRQNRYTVHYTVETHDQVWGKLRDLGMKEGMRVLCDGIFIDSLYFRRIFAFYKSAHESFLRVDFTDAAGTVIERLVDQPGEHFDVVVEVPFRSFL